VAGRIAKVRSGSIADEMEIVPGDLLLSINGYTINDILDYQFHSEDDYIIMEIQKENNEIWSLEIEKEYDEELGIDFAELVFDRMKYCQNRCVFCFVDQLPPHMRKTLYIKDDDFRHSFINGNFITLTNLSENDWEKILSMRLSPLYVSVHCIQGELRKEMLKNPRAGNIKADLQRLKTAGIEVHTQIVLCPGWNDGVILTETIEELAKLYPEVASVGIVPVGLTGYRQDLPQLSPVTGEMALDLIHSLESYQQCFRQQWGKGFVYLADEFYLRANLGIPGAEYYDDYCQIENGIGLARMLLDEFYELAASLPGAIAEREVFMITGKSAVPILQDLVARLNQIEGLSVILLPVTNNYFGGGVSVTGLLTGQDIIRTLGSSYQDKIVIIPGVVLRDGQDILLDDTSLEDIKKKTQANIRISDGSARSLIEAILAD
jgi:putative radical SAM enzyme (TIGR03279 family)